MSTKKENVLKAGKTTAVNRFYTNRLWRQLLIICIFVCQSLHAATQSLELGFSKYTLKEGLSSTTIYDIIKDSFGFIWLATEDGLNRFDGSGFKVYRHDPSNPRSLRVNHISSLYESSDGCLWIGTNGGGLSFYDRAKDSVYNYTPQEPYYLGAAIISVTGDRKGHVWVTGFGTLHAIDPQTKKLVTADKFEAIAKAHGNNVTTTFLQDSKENYWIGTNHGLHVYDKNQRHIAFYKHDEANEKSLPHNGVKEIEEDYLGRIWVATEEGLSMLLPDGKGFRNISQHSGKTKITGKAVHALAADNNKKLWIGTDEGLNVLDLESDSITSYIPNKREPNSISSHSIRSIYNDKQGIHWIGTHRGGLNKYDENFSYFKSVSYNAFDPYGLRSPIVTAFAEYNGRIFVGTDGGGIQLFNRATGLLEHVKLPVEASSTQHDLSILSLELSSQNLLWIGTFAKGLYAYNPATGAIRHYTKGPDPSDLSNTDIYCLKEDSRGNLWVGTNGGGINVIKPGQTEIEKYIHNPMDPNPQLQPNNNFIKVFEEDRNGQIWVGTFGSGISLFNPGSKKFTFYTKAKSGLPNDYIMSIKEDRNGNIWVGTNGNGLAVLRKGSTSFETISEKDGLINGIINKIIEDEAGILWISTNKGISAYNPATKKFKNYSIENGLQAGAFIPRSGLLTTDGTIFFGGQQGLNYFNPARLITNKNIPPVVFTGLQVDNQPVVPGKNQPISASILLATELRLKYNQSFLIGFEALDFAAPASNQYEYQLQGFDRDWVTAGKDHNAYYAKLPPGEYTFKVRASNNDGIWNEEGRSIKVYVSPPWWRTVYAYTAYLLLAGVVFYYIRRRSIEKIQARFALEQERKGARELIERERKEAEYLRKLDQMKIKFLTNLSHEFKTPISLIMGPVDNLITQIKDDVLSGQLSLIKRNTRRLLNLVNQLLDFRKMEEGEIRLQASEGDLVSFIKDVCDSFNDLAQRKKIEFGFYASTTTLPVMFDHNKMERVLFNLLSNAFKFTPEQGTISVNLVQSATTTEGIANITVSVQDTGIGIPKEAQGRIFESFFQHDSSITILNQGTGIGLSIAKEFVNIHNGRLWVESEPGRGATFSFEMPLPLVVKEENAPAPVQVEHTNGLPKTLPEQPHINGTHPAVLIVEDDDDFRYYIRENLKNHYRILEAPNGKEGWQRTLFHHPDIVVCDIQMPVMNGLELVQKLKADKRTKHIPVILLTAANTPSGLLDGLETGAIDYMNKPFDFAVLQAKINNILVLNQSFKDTYLKQVTVSLPETEVVSEKEKFLQKTLSYIYENIDNPQLSVEILSTHMHISRASLYNKLLEFTGKSPVEFIRTVKLEKARDLLEKSDLTVTEIAYETGFANPNYFTKVFKTKYGMTPSEYLAEKRIKA